MKPRKTPQEKKKLSYEKDCRNSYGENDKSSRKAIRRRKRWVNKTYRKATKQKLQAPISTDEELDAYDLVDKVKEVRRKTWRKDPDMPLGEYIGRQQKYWKRRVKKKEQE